MAGAENEPELEIKAYNLNYGNSVYISYAISCENIPEGAKVQLLVWDKPQEEYIKGTELASSYTNGTTAKVGGVEYPVFVFNKIIARQMATDFYAVAYVKTADGEYYSAPTKYSVLQYVYNKLGYTGTASTDESYINLLKETLVYGAAAQKRFSKEDTRLADLPFYQVTVSGGTISDGFNKGLYLEGEKITLIAPETDVNGNSFSHWEDAEKNSVSTSLSYEITVEKYHESYTAVYKKVSRGLEYDSNGDGTCYVVGMGTCTDTEIIIPETALGGDSVIGIDNSAFANSAITSITIPASVVEIGRKAFSSCTSLTDVYYSGLSEEWETVTILTGNEALENATMHFAEALKCNVTFVDYDGTVISKESVLHGSYISEPKSLTRKGYSFDGWYLRDKKWSFDIDAVTKNITLTAKWSELVASDGLIYHHLPDGTYGIMGGNAMKLETVIIPETCNGKAVTTIMSGAFKDATNIKEIILPDNITTIEKEAFSGCTNLVSMEIPNNVVLIGENAFFDCTKLKKSYDNAYYIGNNENPYLWLMEARTTYINNCTIHNDTKYISPNAFYECSSLKSIDIPNSVTFIGNHAFYKCTSITSITLGSNVTSIGKYAFAYCEKLTGIVIPDSVVSLDSHILYSCRALSKVTLGNGITSIEMCMFYNCTSLSRIVLPDSVTKIYSSAFSGCSNLSSIVIPTSVTYIGPSVFSSYSSYGFTIKYCGTKEEWDAISKASSWINTNNRYSITYNYTEQ